MHVATQLFGRQSWRRLSLLAVGLAVTLSAAVISMNSADAQTTTTHSFYGFGGDITIDGQPLPTGTEIAAIIGDEVVASALVSESGSWIIEVPTSDIEEQPCNVLLVVNGFEAGQTWETCPMRVMLELSSGADGDADMLETASSDDMMEDDSDSMMEDDDMMEDDSDDMMENDGMMEEDDDGMMDGDEQTEAVTPTAPGTGTGGLLSSDEANRWPIAVAITALLTFGVAALSQLISRRTDGVS